MGHALDILPQDSLTRYHRMKGDPTLWLPGSDHASIATEAKIVEALRGEGKDKRGIGRDEFLKRAWAWREEYGRRIVQQQRKLGASCDWSRERFTMDEGMSRAVIEVFVRLYEKGLIYRGDRIINWCVKCETALSDAEVEYEEREDKLYYIKYPGSDGFDAVVATTRPETMLGDTGMAVNPTDARYARLVGRYVTLPLINRQIPVIADEYVDPEFGTGAVKITPAHDPNDFEVGQRHNLEVLRVLNDNGTMSEAAGKYAGLTREACRAAILADLDKLGLLVKIEPLTHNVGECYRCHKTVEPLVSTQWFVKMKPLAEPALEAVKTDRIRFVPERFTKVYYNWMENIRDWCVSRQLWWGHRIPAYYCDFCGEMTVLREAPAGCPKCDSPLRQDEDVLDTWFSSALWPFSTLGWPEETEDYKYFYPTTVLCCGYDIIFFWAARMIFSGIEQTGKPPFQTVLMNGMVRDEKGQKMSKSAGNGIDPLDVVEKYGADALRISLVLGVASGGDQRISDGKIEASRNFANKIWNAARFALMNLNDYNPEGLPDAIAMTLADRWIVTRLRDVAAEVTQHMEAFNLGLAAQASYDFIWDMCCDWYIEACKGRLHSGGGERRTAQGVLVYVLSEAMKLLHPFMPFITDEIYQSLPGMRGSIMLSGWPVASDMPAYPEDAEMMEGIMEAIRAIRNLRADMKVQHGTRARLMLRPREGWHSALQDSEELFIRLAGASSVKILTCESASPEQSASAICRACELFIPLGDLINVGIELLRLAKERESALAEIARSNAKLANEGFLQKAPARLIEEEREKLVARRAALESLDNRMETLKAL
jgi:valyl-tRNA synthetase